MNETYMKERPILPLLMSMALPMVISMLVNSLYNIVDSFFVAQISENAMTTLSLVFPIQNFINAVSIGFGVGMNAVIAFYLGAEEASKANTAATRGLLFAFIHGVILTVVCIAVMPAFLRMFTSDQEVIDMGICYSNIVFLFTVVIVSELAFEKIFQAAGRMKVSMFSMLGGCIANILLDPVLIFGLGPFPEMGIKGAALATGIGQVLTLVIYLIVCFVRPIPVRIEKKYLVRDQGLDRKIYSVGIPAALNLALPSLMISCFNAILSAYSQIYVLILGIYYKLQTFLYLTSNGIVQGMRPVIGYNYGAEEYVRVKKIYQTALCMSGVIMIAGTVICLAVPGKLIGLFTDSQETVLAGEKALRIISAGFLVSAVSVTSSGALEGLGKGLPSFVISLLRYVAVIIPAAYILSRILGPSGVWHAFWIAESITAAASFYIYRRAF